jgi:nanoRNase/pAp phosphatase (c-di-AMP/oligoRNAs hydrolase)
MDLTADITKVKDLLDKAQNVLIATHDHPTFDSIGSALTLSIGLSSLGKRVTVVCPDPMTVDLSNFIGVQKIQKETSGKNFVISLDYAEGSIEKVSYNIEGNKFNLVIEPRPGYDGFSEDKVHYTHGGGSADLIFTVDTDHTGALKKVYDDNKELFAGKPVVNVDRHPNTAKFGTVNLVDPNASSTVEVISQILSHIGVALTTDIATNVLNALYSATDNFQNPNVSVASFELAAACLKAGGIRFRGVGVAPSEEVPARETIAVKSPAQIMESKPVARPAPVVSSGQAPPDWLKPKIFKSSGLI